jgi:hypothetical protein
MNFRRIVSCLTLLAALGAAFSAHAQNQQRVRCTITAIDGDTLSVKTREGEDLKLALTPKTTYGAVKKIELSEIKPGSFIGTSAVKGEGGVLVAREVHVLPPGTNPGHRPWDLEPGSTMTNANVNAVMNDAVTNNIKGRVLTLDYPGGSQKVLVPESAPVVVGIPATRADLKVGEYAYIAAEQGADGKVVAVRVQMSRDGVRPPQ